MGFITNQWLEGDPERSRGHSPVKVKFIPRNCTDDWSQRNNVVCAIEATNEKGDYQMIYLSNDDLAAVLPSLFSRQSDVSIRKSVGSEALWGLDDTALLEVLRAVFLRRGR